MSIDKKQIVTVQDMRRSDLLLADSIDAVISGKIRHFVDLNMDKCTGLPEGFKLILEAAVERLDWLSDRVDNFELGVDLAHASNNAVCRVMKNFQDKKDILRCVIPIDHAEFGPEPQACYEVMENGFRRRFVNPDWLRWYAKFNPQLAQQDIINCCAQRVVESLFPTEASRKDLDWSVKTKAKEEEGQVYYPMELVIERTKKTRE